MVGNLYLGVALFAVAASIVILVWVVWLAWTDERDYQKRVKKYHDYLYHPPHDRSE